MLLFSVGLILMNQVDNQMVISESVCPDPKLGGRAEVRKKQQLRLPALGGWGQG